ncbi:hypothetical protein MLD38_024373 [Melastoma candidum]|uniref:Uncharacterized protein n=1 Tax=Melastoma candidum TaxID=119954 RepID=A0ACB9NTM2_9MYRT|nr:hypothetical protein MLD38_024373 [Melastoma candidum]
MSRERDSPVQVQMATALLEIPHGRDYHRDEQYEGRQPSGRRRVFVQTETGCVLGMELDGGDNVQTVKRRLQVALNFPTDESSLTCGDVVLKNDLSTVWNDSPLLLTLKNLHKSSSTPCLYPTGGETYPRDKSRLIEVLGLSSRFDWTKSFFGDIVKAIKMGVDPIPVHSGLGGAYVFRNFRGECLAIVKPTDEEPFAPNNPQGFVGKALGQPGLKRSIRVGETGIREVAAYLLDYNRFANVPPTALVKISHSIFNVNNGVNPNKSNEKKVVSKIASFQQFMPHDFDASDCGASRFPVAAVHRIGILDIRIFNTDRHAGNLLVEKLDAMGRFGHVALVPIDHGLCLPETLEDPYFEWMHWPQALIPFSEEELKYIEMLDPLTDCVMLQAELPMIREACLRVLTLCTIFLKEAATHGLCLSEIGEMMSREFRSGEEGPSELEAVCIEAGRSIQSIREETLPPSDAGDEEFQFDIDCEELETDVAAKMTTDTRMHQAHPPFVIGNGSKDHNPLFQLDEVTEEEDSEEEHDNWGDLARCHASGRAPSVSKLSMSLRNTTLGKKNVKQHKYSYELQAGGCMANSSSGHRSADEQLPARLSFVTLADMSEEEWGHFLEKFQELLQPAFANRKSISNQRQWQRLGTSCQF